MIHVAVLAGGQSRRMGRDKALLQLGGQTLIERVLAATHPLGYPHVIIGDPIAYAHLGLPVHPDRRPGLGPLGGLHTALSTTAAPVLLLACDLPFLTPDFLRHLVNRRGPHQAIVPYTATGLQPLCALYESSCLAAVETALDAERLSLRDLLTDLSLDLVREKDWRPYDERGLLFANLNAPEEYERAQAALLKSGVHHAQHQQ
ncbi:MAG: molybdenum cofactor guanylyltransferase [Candidatus Latescibacteria bacterium]|nr:molybdenum cofactor guanylyltransferase [Candidatus Latescibacterota bacterium]